MKMMGLVALPTSVALGEPLTPCGNLVAVMSPGCVGARDATYSTSPCWWRGAGRASMQNSFFPGAFQLQCGSGDKFSHPKGAWQVSQMSLVGAQQLFFGGASCRLPIPKLSFLFQNKLFSEGWRGGETNGIICLRLRFTAASKI